MEFEFEYNKIQQKHHKSENQSLNARTPRFENHLHSVAATSACSVIGNNEIRN